MKRKLLQVGFIRLIFIYATLSAITDISLFVLGRLSIPNLLYANIWSVIELGILAGLFAELMPRYKKFLIGCVILFGLFFLIDSIWLEPITKQFQTHVFAAESLLITLFGVVYYVYLYKMDAGVEAVYKFGLLIILMSLMAYYMMASLLFSYSQYVECTPTDQMVVLYVNYFLNIAKNVGLVIGIVTLREASAPQAKLGGMLLVDKIRKSNDNRRWN